MSSGKPESSEVAGSSRVVPLLVVLNLLLLGGLLYVVFGRALTRGEGVSLVIVNETPSPMVDFKLSYPGGQFEVPELGAGRSVGNPAPVAGEFDAVLTFKDGSGVERTQTLPIRPLGELLIVVHVFPVLEAATTTDEAGAEQTAVRIVPGQYRIVTAYKGENASI